MLPFDISTPSLLSLSRLHFRHSLFRFSLGLLRATTVCRQSRLFSKMSGKSQAKRIEEMTPEERLQSLQEFAEEKKYVRPGEDGTLPSGQAGIAALAFGGPMRQQQSVYTTPLAPPSYSSAIGEQEPAEKQRKSSLVGRLFGKKDNKKGE